MRGNPLLRAALLGLALCLAGLLVAAVVGNSGPPPDSTASTPPVPAATTRVPTLLTFTLSAPATSITLTEPSGRSFALPNPHGLSLEHETELSVTGSAWHANLTVEWQNPSRHNFLRLDFEPERLKSSSLTLHFRPNTTEQPIITSFDLNP